MTVQIMIPIHSVWNDVSLFANIFHFSPQMDSHHPKQYQGLFSLHFEYLQASPNQLLVDKQCDYFLMAHQTSKE
ncbi:hypothetical protein AU512_16505 [Lonsdalea iberica]|uniref:Uncharacterized protein n=1 Tax=Lonsdalea iberica TaxID=1082703 RepID=A0ABX3XBU4_9GAMM|nr:hypothetical protein AU512_16505 [Lonsdalea iberica]